MKYQTIKNMICLLCAATIFSSVSAATSIKDRFQEQTIFVRIITDNGIVTERINTNEMNQNNPTPVLVVRRPWKLCSDGSCSTD
jgi:hypothetical protein